MHYQASTIWTPREALEHALAEFGPHGLGLDVLTTTNLSVKLQGGGGYITITAQPGSLTTLELETREWDYAVQQFMARLPQRRSWWQRWRRRRTSSASRPASLTILDQ